MLYRYPACARTDTCDLGLGVGGWGTQAINSAMSDWEERCPAILPIILNLGCTAALLSLLLGVAADQGQCAIRSRVFGNRYSNVIYVR